jgi:DNA processing protein
MSAAEEERRARALLSLIGEPGDPRLTGLVSELGALEVLAALRRESRHGELRESLTERLRGARPDDVLAATTARGIRFVTPASPEWPTCLDDLGSAPLLHERGGVPIGLWVRGPLRLDEAVARAVSVVGSRSATSYGARVAADLAATVAGTGHAVVSGAAFGIDQAAHRGALSVQGPTVAVLACGVDRAYPSAHADLLEHIAEVGLVVSEAAPGFAPMRVRFLARNRLIAAFGRGTVVVEAAVRSGALNTANWAAGLSRVLMGVPGPVTSASSQGVHQLIRNRNALLVTDGAEVLEAVAEAGTFLLRHPAEAPGRRDVLTTRERQVLDAVPVTRGAEVSSIARTAGLPVAAVRSALGVLAEAELVVHADGRWRLAVQPTPEPAGGARRASGESSS